MGRYRTINVDLNRQYRNDLNSNFAQIEQDILGQENFTVEMKNELLTELQRIERESKDRDNTLAKQNLEVLLQSIEDAKANANTAASNANTKATHAQTQGDYAKSQGDYAKNQGDYAKTKGDYADEKAILADEAASNANAEASNLSQLKVEVVSATQNANNAKTNADTATTNANNAATYATTQGDYAKQQGDRAREVVETAPVVSVNEKKGVVNLNAGDVGAIPSTDKGVANGVAQLNGNGKVVDASGKEVEGKVKTVNNVAPDGNGNITVPTFSGNYNDLSNKPTIPSKTSELENDNGFLTTVTKSTIGLGSVQNYGIATQAEAEAGTATNKYMTPQRTKQAIDTLQAVKSVNGQTGNIVIESGGEIIESGSNANGNYLKYSSGILICYRRAMVLSYSSSTLLANAWTFPHNFIQPPTIFMTANRELAPTEYLNNTKLLIANDTQSLTSISLEAIGTYGINMYGRINVMAIGRWK